MIDMPTKFYVGCSTVLGGLNFQNYYKTVVSIIQSAPKMAASNQKKTNCGNLQGLFQESSRKFHVADQLGVLNFQNRKQFHVFWCKTILALDRRGVKLIFVVVHI